MAYTLTVEPRSGYLHIRVNGEISPQAVRAYLVEVHAQCMKHKTPRVLIEENLRGPTLGTLDVFSVINERSTDAREAVLTIAYVDANADHDPAITQFAENVAVNRGVHVRAFASVADAERWIKGESK